MAPTLGLMQHRESLAPTIPSVAPSASDVYNWQVLDARYSLALKRELGAITATTAAASPPEGAGRTAAPPPLMLTPEALKYCVTLI